MQIRVKIPVCYRINNQLKSIKIPIKRKEKEGKTMDMFVQELKYGGITMVTEVEKGHTATDERQMSYMEIKPVFYVHLRDTDNIKRFECTGRP